MLVKQKEGLPRICCDGRRINKKIIEDSFHLPLIEDVLDRLQGPTYFSTDDLPNESFHVNEKETSRKYTVFMTNNGQTEIFQCPFGQSNSPAVLQRFISHIITYHCIIWRNYYITFE